MAFLNGKQIPFAYATIKGAGVDASTFILVDDEGTEVAAFLTGEAVELTATAEDIRKGKTAVTDNGVIVGTADFAGTGGGGGDHTITFMSEDGETVLGTKTVMHGDTSGDPVALGLFETPTKQSTVQYDYAFYGWSDKAHGAAKDTALENVTEDRTVYAAFTAAIHYYSVNYYDGNTLLKTEKLAYGATPSYTPVKSGYVFVGFTPSLVSVTGDANYYAQFDETVIASGDCGDNATWTLGGSGVLNITGTGNITDYENGSEQPWYEYRDNITAVTIGDGITGIGKNAFYGCKNAQSVVFPNSLQTIGVYAFGACSKLNNVIIPQAVVYISYYAFMFCNALTSAYFAVTTGWKATHRDTGVVTTITTINNSTTAATYLKSTYNEHIWERT